MAKLSCEFLLPAMAAVILFPIVAMSADKTPDQAKSIAVAELNKLQVIGQLGQPLGKIVTIEGVAADDSYRKMKEDVGHTILRIQTVDGKKLPDEQVFHFQPFVAGLEKPKIAGKFKYIGYETGGFTGVPDKTFDYVPAIATTGHYFTTHFVILRDEMRVKQ